MALNDITINDVAANGAIPTRTYQVTSGAAASIKAGEPVVLTTIGTSAFAKAAVDAMPTIGTDYLVGIAASTSTDTVAAVGTVNVYTPLPGVIYRGVAKSATAANTDAKIAALANKRTIFDLTSSTWTLDTAAADASTSGLILTGTGDSTRNMVDFMISTRATNISF